MTNKQAELAERLLDVIATEDYGTKVQDLTVADLLDDLDGAGLALVEAEGVAMMAYIRELVKANNDK